MSIDKLLHGLAESLKNEIPATGEAILSFTEACRWADNDPRERQRLSDIADLLDAEETLYADARAALERGDQHAALWLLRQCAGAGNGEAHWLLAQLLEDLGHIGEASTWYQHAADDGDSRAVEKLAGLSVRQCLCADNAAERPQRLPGAPDLRFLSAADCDCSTHIPVTALLAAGRPAIAPKDDDGVIGYRQADDKPEHGEHGKRRASRGKRRPVHRLAVPDIGRFAIVAATAAAIAVAVIGSVRTPLPGASVPLPAIKTASLVTSMSDTLLFPSGSAALAPSAYALLRPLAQQARSQHLAVSITGYASPGGTTTQDLVLSERRAAVIRDQLMALGVPAVQITQVSGDGAPRQLLNACRLDETKCAGLRRVVIVLSPEAP